MTDVEFVIAELERCHRMELARIDLRAANLELIVVDLRAEVTVLVAKQAATHGTLLEELALLQATVADLRGRP